MDMNKVLINKINVFINNKTFNFYIKSKGWMKRFSYEIMQFFRDKINNPMKTIVIRFIKCYMDLMINLIKKNLK